MEENVNVESGKNGGEVSEKAKAILKSSYTWVMVIAILGFIGGGIMAIGGLLALIGSITSGLVTLIMAAIYIYGYATLKTGKRC